MNRLLEIISSETQKHAVIPFARFMQLALYCPVYGYYEKERDTVGRHGDFFTSVSVGNLFGKLLAFQFSEWLDEARAAKRELRLVEAGAHRGQLASDILTWLREQRPELYDESRYVIIEPSARRQEWQKQMLQEFDDKTTWVARPQDLGEEGVCGLIFSNELLDAMPVRRLGWDAAKHEWFEWGVAVQDGKLTWARMEIPQAGVRKAEVEGPRSKVQSPKSKVQSPKSKVEGPTPAPCLTPDASRLPYPELPDALLDALPDAFTTELCPAAVEWWSEAARTLRRGRLLTIDYGLSAEEFLEPERKEGTLRAYFRHHLHNDLLANVGEQDITAHVNFTAIQQAGEAAGLKTEQLVTQSQFLTRIVERMSNRQDSSVEWASAWNRQFQTLTHPDHLGRLFRVLVQSRR